MESIHEWDTTPVARKNHKCIICKEMIVPGTKYVRKTRITLASKMVTTTFHIKCEDLLDEHLDTLDHKLQTHKDVMFEPYIEI